MKHIAFIPSKGNSEGVPKKNLQKIGDHTLVEWSLEIAIESNLFDTVVISTESPEVIESLPRLVGHLEEFKSSKHDYCLEVSNGIQIHKRGLAYATRLASTLDLIDSYLNSQKLEEFSCLTLLQPTCPFRSISELADILSLMENEKVHSLASARLFDSPHPQKAIRISEDSSIKADASELKLLSTPRQELDKLYVLDGAYYCIDVRQFKKTKRLVDQGTRIIRRKGISTMNIDNEDDLQYARYLYEIRRDLIRWTPKPKND